MPRKRKIPNWHFDEDIPYVICSHCYANVDPGAWNRHQTRCPALRGTGTLATFSLIEDYFPLAAPSAPAPDNSNPSPPRHEPLHQDVPDAAPSPIGNGGVGYLSPPHDSVDHATLDIQDVPADPATLHGGDIDADAQYKPLSRRQRC